MTQTEACDRIMIAQKVVEAAYKNDLMTIHKTKEAEFIRIANELVAPLGVGVRKGATLGYWYEFFVTLSYEMVAKGTESSPVRVG